MFLQNQNRIESYENVFLGLMVNVTVRKNQKSQIIQLHVWFIVEISTTFAQDVFFTRYSQILINHSIHSIHSLIHSFVHAFITPLSPPPLPPTKNPLLPLLKASVSP